MPDVEMWRVIAGAALVVLAELVAWLVWEMRRQNH
jgi:hypothetical protein